MKGGGEEIDATGSAADPTCWLEILHRPVGQKAFVVVRTADKQILRAVKSLILVKLAAHSALSKRHSAVVSMWEEAELRKLEGVLSKLIPDEGVDALRQPH